MNLSEEEKAHREGARLELRKLVTDLQESEAFVVQAAEKAASEIIRTNYPVVAGCAIQAGAMTVKLTMDILFDLTPGAKSVEARGYVQPPVISSAVRHTITETGDFATTT